MDHSDQRVSSVLSLLQERYGIMCGEALTLGNVCAHVYRGNRNQEPIVVKIGFSKKEAEEIRLNIKGYEELKAMGAQDLIPEMIEVISGLEAPVLIMTDCGSDFWHASKSAPDPVALYRQLADGMRNVYRSSLLPVDACRSCLEPVRALLLRQYEAHLAADVGPEVIQWVRQASLASLRSPFACFSSFDFTPEDVFVTKRGVKYVDPKPGMVGVPIIDLACFAGVARDAHGLPGSSEGYEILKSFSLNDMCDLLGMEEECAARVFALGRALQSAFSARFRLQQDPARAGVLVAQSVQYARAALEE